jgi:type IV pilus assembly protein PilY1
MKKLSFLLSLFRPVLLVALGAAISGAAMAQSIPMAQTPILALKSAPGLVMLTMSRDQRLFYSAYNDITDLDGDGTIDVGFKPGTTYYGYFASDRCYKFDSSVTPKRFVPVALANASTGCLSVTTARWHGNWLNWAATSRMDALRKVLYGGYRVTDDSSTTVLEAASIPPDSHIWGKEYRPVVSGGTDAYNITYYTPLPMPTASSGASSTGSGTGSPGMHIFLVRNDANSTSPYLGGGTPQLRVVQNVNANIDRVWLWASSERPVGILGGSTKYRRPNSSDPANTGAVTGSGYTYNPTTSLINYPLPGFTNIGGSATSYSSRDFSDSYTLDVRVETCVNLGAGIGRESNCTGYPTATPTVWKPTGVLHQYGGSTNALKFGLLTGSYTLNYSGGVVRKDIGTFTDEYSASTGIFSTSTNGIVKTINKITYVGFNPYTYVSNSTNAVCPSGTFVWNRLRCEGEVNSWGAPIAEMMYEGIRYFTDKQPTAAYSSNVSDAASLDTKLGLPLVTTWSNPYRSTSGGSPTCSRPVQMVISDPVTSFDSDQLPGAAYSPDTGRGTSLGAGDMTGLNVSTQADAIWSSEFGATTSKNFFVGQSTSTNSDGNPSAKAATSFKFMRGHAPDETNTQGSYYAASVARFARNTGIPIRTASGASTQTVQLDTISVALGSVIPKLEFSYAGKTVSLVPFGKTVGGCSPAASAAPTAPNGFQPTSLITGLFFDRIANTSTSNTDSSINNGRPFLRFMVSFSDMDVGGDNEADANVYYTVYIDSAGKLQVRLDSYLTATCAVMHLGYVISGTSKDGSYLEVKSFGSSDIKYYLDTPGTLDPAPATGRDPVSNLPTSKVREFTLSSTSTASYVPKDPLWYAAKYGGAGVLDAKGDPTNYFKVTNPGELPAQMGKAFRAAAALAAVASTSVTGEGVRSSGSAAVYQASYDSLTWSSRLYAFPVSSVNGSASDTAAWEASSKLGAPASRNLYLGRGGTNAPVRLLPSNWTSLTAAELADFESLPSDWASLTASQKDALVTSGRFAYLLGDKSNEERKGGKYRNRGTTAGADFGSSLGDIVNSDPQIIASRDYGYTASDPTYASYLSTLNFETIAVGANDGFFHIFDAEPSAAGGVELLGFMPQAARASILELSQPEYQHRFTVDGAIGMGHAKIVVPGASTADWRTVVVGTGGAGARTVFAINASSKVFTADNILWELNESVLTGAAQAAFGNVMTRPVIGKLPSGVWVAIFGSGYNNTSGTAKLFVVNLENGSIIKILDTNNSIAGNGMTSIEAVRKTSGNQDTIEYVYGADYKGNIWRFDLSTTSTTCTSPSVGGAWCSGAWVYQPPSGRNITADIKIGNSPTGAPAGKMIYFGTGRLLDAADSTDTTVQALYGVFDDTLYTLSTAPAISGDSSLSSMSITLTGGVDDRRTVSTPTTAWWLISGKKGWVVPLTGTGLAPGERVIAPPVRYTQTGVVDAFLFISIVPSADPCKAGLDTWITAVDPATGGAAKAFQSLGENSIKIVGGSPRGAFVLSDSRAPTLYISQTVFNVSSPPTSSFTTIAGGTQTVTINGVAGMTRVLGINLTPAPTVVPTITRQIWRQIK